VNSDGVHTSTDPRPHATVSASTEVMRANKQSIVHHVYFDKTNPSESCPEGIYIGHRIHGTVVADPKHVRNSYDTARVHRSVFDDAIPGRTAVGFAPLLNSYYVPDESGQYQQLITLLPHPSEQQTWYFTNPNTNQSTIALFPTGCGVPLPTQLPSTPEADDPAPTMLPSPWRRTTTGETQALVSYKAATPGASTDCETASGPALYGAIFSNDGTVRSLAKDSEDARVVDSTVLAWSGWFWSKEWEQWVRTRKTLAGNREYQYQTLDTPWSPWYWSEEHGQWARYAKDPDQSWAYDFKPDNKDLVETS
jgi:hypothetical protein